MDPSFLRWFCHMEDYRCWHKHENEGLNEAEMRDSYMEREVPTGVKEERDDVNKQIY
jgi:hypothetical protein